MAAPVRPATAVRPVASLAVFQTRLANAEEFAAVMARALREIETFPGLEYAIQLQSVDDSALFADYVVWSDLASADGAGGCAAASPAFAPYLEATGDEHLFAHLVAATGAVPPHAGRGAETFEIVHLPSGHPLGAPSALAELARAVRTRGAEEAVAGTLSGPIGEGAALVAVWRDPAAASGAESLVAELSTDRLEPGPAGARAWRFRARGWFVADPSRRAACGVGVS